MKLLIDENLPTDVAGLLRDLGHEAIHIRELGMAGSKDDVLVPFASLGGFSIVTLDSDFHRILTTQRLTAPSTIRLRIKAASPDRTAQLIHKICLENEAALQAGCMITCSEQKLKVRSLPFPEKKRIRSVRKETR